MIGQVLTSTPTANDHARTLLSWRALPFPTPWDEVFARTGAPQGLTVEVGFGDGRFTTASALSEPDMRFVGLEVSSGSMQRALRRVKRAGVGNVRLAKVGAHMAVRQLFEAESVDRFVVNFPCPWPKERHAKHRLLTRGFFELAGSRLRAGGELRLATDHGDYLGFALEEAAASGLFEALRPEAPAAVFETKYALKWREQGKPLYYVVFRRNGAPAPLLLPLERPAIMPHALLRGKLPLDAGFSKTVFPYGGGHVILHEAMRSFGGEDGTGRVLVRATVEEPDLKQQLLVLAHQRQDDEVIVRIESFGDPLITPAARGCVHGVTEWLLGASSLEVAARNY